MNIIKYRLLVKAIELGNLTKQHPSWDTPNPEPVTRLSRWKKNLGLKSYSVTVPYQTDHRRKIASALYPRSYFM